MAWEVCMIQNAFAINYYVNDVGSLADDIFCTSVGNDLNDGLGPASPKRSIQELINVYRFSFLPGDSIFIDHGVYQESILLKNFLIDGSPIVINGAGKNNTLIEPIPNDTFTFKIMLSSNIKVENIGFTNSSSGITSNVFSIQQSNNLTVNNCGIEKTSKGALALLIFDESEKINILNSRIVHSGDSSNAIFIGAYNNTGKCENILIENCFINAQNALMETLLVSKAIRLKNADSVEIVKNTIHSAEAGIWLGDDTYNTYLENNFVFSDDHFSFFAKGSSSTYGTMFHNSFYSHAPCIGWENSGGTSTEGWVVYNEVV